MSRLVDTETAEILTIVDTYVETEDLTAIKEAAEQLYLKFLREFALVDSDILSFEKRYVLADLGSKKLRAQQM